MKRAVVAAALIALAATPLLAGGKGTVSGTYVEARTAEVFTGGCIMNRCLSLDYVGAPDHPWLGKALLGAGIAAAR